jgi:Uma2 family endonuclease
MATVTEPIPIDAELDEDFDPGRRREVINGLVVRKKSLGAKADRIATRLIGKIESHSDGRLGLCFGAGCGYHSIFPHDRKRFRLPDVSYVRSGRLPDDKLPRGHMRIVPDLIAEAISPNDRAVDIEQRLTDFLKAGVPLAWMIYPLTKQVYVFHQDPASIRLGLGDLLDGEDILPGFRCPLDDLFAAI